MIGGCHHHYVFQWVEPVHLHQHAVDDAIELRFGPTHIAAVAAFADTIHLIDEQHARRVAACEFEERLDLVYSSAVEGRCKVRAIDRDEIGFTFSRKCLGEKRLAGAGRPDQQHASWCHSAETRVVHRVLHERFDAVQRGLCLFLANGVRKLGFGTDSKPGSGATHSAMQPNADDASAHQRGPQQHGRQQAREYVQ